MHVAPNHIAEVVHAENRLHHRRVEVSPHLRSVCESVGKRAGQGACEGQLIHRGDCEAVDGYDLCHQDWQVWVDRHEDAGYVLSGSVAVVALHCK